MFFSKKAFGALAVLFFVWRLVWRRYWRNTGLQRFEWQAESGQGQEKQLLVVIVNGFLGDTSSGRDVALAFAEAGETAGVPLVAQRVQAADVWNESKNLYAEGIEPAADRLAEAVERLRAQHGKSLPVVMVGSSFGGLVVRRSLDRISNVAVK